MLVGEEVMEALEEAAREQEEAGQKGARRRNRTDSGNESAPGSGADSA
jgi:hypothetical protein